MSDCSRLLKLAGHLQAEIGAARAGDTQGQFPILDLVGNLRDEAATHTDKAALAAFCAEAWEHIVKIVESGAVFSADDISWLKELLARVQALAGLADSSSAAALPAPGAPNAETPTATPAMSPPAALVPNALEELPLTLNLAEDTELLREFINESREHLDNIERGVLVLENRPDDAETLNTVFRAFHTFKGGAGFLNLIPINRLAHVLESLLDLARQNKLVIDATVIELILRGRDVLKQFLDEMDGQIAGVRPVQATIIPTAVLKAEVQEVIEGKPHSTPTEAAPAGADDEKAPATNQVSPEAGETKVVVAAAPVAVEANRVSPPAAESAEASRSNVPQTGGMVKVDTAKLDGLLDLVGEMVIAQSLVGQNLGQLASLDPQFARNIAQLGRITKELQRVSMALRMVPIRGVFQKMSRVVRDLGAKQKKKVQFTTSGEDTELDRGVVEELNDPLLHMIRNSMDHGIETPEKRKAAGKPELGTLHLRAYHQGGNIVVEVEDDGAGLNKEKILKKAIERGLASAGATLTDDEIYHFIFAAGFSTAEKVTDLSGRGVGLDVVRRNIERLRGQVNISCKPGKGTMFRISLPLTLAIIDGFIVKVGEERYIIPTLSVRESFRPQPGMVTEIQNRAEVVNVRGRIIPLLRLNQTFGLTQTRSDVTEGIVVVVEAGTDSRCLLVDGLLHKQEVVIKNLNDMLVYKNHLLAGAAILGDGRVGLILDVNALVHLDAQSLKTFAPALTAGTATA